MNRMFHERPMDPQRRFDLARQACEASPTSYNVGCLLMATHILRVQGAISDEDVGKTIFYCAARLIEHEEFRVEALAHTKSLMQDDA